eukprot:538274-Prymnesium_polylepis.1
MHCAGAIASQCPHATAGHVCCTSCSGLARASSKAVPPTKIDATIGPMVCCKSQLCTNVWRRLCRKRYHSCSAAPSSAPPSPAHMKSRHVSSCSRSSRRSCVAVSPAAAIEAATVRGGARRQTARPCRRRTKKTLRCAMPEASLMCCPRGAAR